MKVRKHRARRPGRLAIERLEDRENPDGTVAASLSAGGVLSLKGDALDNDVQVQLTATGAVITGLNGTTIDANGSAGAAATLTGNVRHLVVDLKGGNDRFAIDATTDFGLSGHAFVNLGAGDNTLDMTTSAALNIAGNLRVRAASGNDNINISGGAQSTIGGHAHVFLGAGGSTVNISNITVDHPAGLAVVAGAGTDTVNLNGVVTTRGGALVFGANGDLDVNVDATTSIAGAFTVRGLRGANVDVSGGNFGHLIVSGGAFGNTDVNITGSTNVKGNAVVVGSFANLNASAGNLDVGGSAIVRARANATLHATGAGVNIGRHVLISSGLKTDLNFATTGTAQVGGTISVLGGLDADSIVANANLDVDGHAVFNLRGGNNNVSLGGGADLDIGGNLAIVAGAGDDTVMFDQVKVAGNTIIRLGAGSDTLTIRDGTVVSGATLIDLGAGADILNVATDTSASAGVTFNGRAVLLGGLGNDQVVLGLAAALGGNAATTVTFNSPGNILNLGLGVDVFVQANAQIIGALGVFNLP